MNFTAIDFETANCARASVCAVGLVRVENGKTVAEYNTLINPETYFDWRCVNVHGITPEDVESAPTFPKVWKEIKPFLSDNVVAHNAPFDMSCLRAALAEFRPPDASEFDYICTLAISRRLFGMAETASTNLRKNSGFTHLGTTTLLKTPPYALKYLKFLKPAQMYPLLKSVSSPPFDFGLRDGSLPRTRKIFQRK